MDAVLFVSNLAAEYRQTFRKVLRGGIGNRNLFEITLTPNFSGNKGGLFECRGWENMNGVVKLSIQRTFAGEVLLQNLVTVGPLHFFSVFKSSSLNRLLTRVRYSQLDQICK